MKRSVAYSTMHMRTSNSCWAKSVIRNGNRRTTGELSEACQRKQAFPSIAPQPLFGHTHVPRQGIAPKSVSGFKAGTDETFGHPFLCDLPQMHGRTDRKRPYQIRTVIPSEPCQPCYLVGQ